MNDLYMSGNLSERLAVSSTSGALVTVKFENGLKHMMGPFLSITEKKSGCEITFTLNEQDTPLNYFGLNAETVIINTGSESLKLNGKFRIRSIERNNNFVVCIGANKYERNIRHESDANS